MKMLLTSAGLTNTYIETTLEELAGKPLSEVAVAFVPTAANQVAEEKGWLIDNLVAFQKRCKSVDIVDIAVATNFKERFAVADVICMGGGNEQYLAQVINTLGIQEYLRELLREKVYMGISAGSMVAGQFISQELMRLVYPEEINPGTQPALGFVDFVFIPHLNSEWFVHVRKENLESLKNQFTARVYATDDETALKIEDGRLVIVGGGDYWTYTP